MTTNNHRDLLTDRDLRSDSLPSTTSRADEAAGLVETCAHVALLLSLLGAMIITGRRAGDTDSAAAATTVVAAETSSSPAPATRCL